MAATFETANGTTNITLAYSAESTGLASFFQELVASYLGGSREEALAVAQAMSNQELLDYWYTRVREEAVVRRNSFISNLEQDVAREDAREAAIYTINEV